MNQVEFYYAMKNIENIIGYIILFIILGIPILCFIISEIYYKIKEKLEKWRNKNDKFKNI